MLMVMMSTRLRRAGVQAVHIVERLRDRAVAEQHDAVGDPDRHDFGKRRAAEQRLSRLAGAGEDAERAGAVPEIGEQSAGLVAGVVGIVVVDEIARDVLAQPLRQRVVLRIVAGIEMRDANLGGHLRSADRGDRRHRTANARDRETSRDLDCRAENPRSERRRCRMIAPAPSRARHRCR